MSVSTVLGLIMALGVFLWTTLTSTESSGVFLDAHAAMIVIGGTIAASMISFSFVRIRALTKIFFKKALGRENDTGKVVDEIVDLARGYRQDNNYLKSQAGNLTHPFLKESIEIMVAGGIEDHELDEILVKRVRNYYKQLEEDAENFKAMSKFPPAFGLLGAVIGMISMMQSMGGADTLHKVGPALAVALVATLYGIAIANFFFLPLAENISRINKKELAVNQMICDAIKLIRVKKHPFMVAETCKSYLASSDKRAKQSLKAVA